MTYLPAPYFYPYAMQGPAASRPPATGSGSPPRDSLYWATDTSTLSITDGSAWSNIGGAGGSAVTSVFTRIGAVVAVNGDYYGVVAAALAGATATSRYSGATTGGAPVSGTFAVGDFIVDQTGSFWLCTVAGTPGTWVQLGAGSLIQSGAGSPVGVVTPVGIGALYLDTTDGAVWVAINTTSGNWNPVGGWISGAGNFGVQLQPVYTDWAIEDTTGSIGIQVADSTVGPTTFATFRTANNILDDGMAGAVTLKSTVATNPGASSAPTLALGTAYQNTLGYDIVLTVYLAVTANVNGVVKLGTDSSATPAQQTIIGASTLTGVWPIPIYLPNNYYALLSTTGTITVSITGQIATPV